MMHNLFKIISHIEKRPSMYFSDEVSLSLLEAWINGYLLGAKKENLTTIQGLTFEDFNYWLTGSLPKTLPESHNWRRRIEHTCESKEESLKLFFVLLAKFNNGKVEKTEQVTEPQVLNWSRGNGNMKLEEFQEIEEVVVRFEIWVHEFSKTTFRFGYNKDNFIVYIEPSIENEISHCRRYTQVKENY